ncbi:helix-turn-helix transcriptional regulator [Parapedobacter indicus]|uniref:Predicted DNA-binding transcriptional regulator YafY, contains an HTH and WYL domains n=1 Tax=Parapedobacter indicus TaxID=1477437 RepID=A0A1I3LM60_9SPHI|nr:YafY family protein [Parapedobacter indicus]PPL01441.1 putative DNA-binding transcriptional regulator YafY [Parapedobacter indicus]SFI85811.1 Predicted DNA-binding transcriptional regulator YafY, contains an HTH and WYL domains [Parapedobacter indicus]
MAVDTAKRFDRIVNIYIQLQSKRVVKAQELADRFGVSLRTIYRDIRSLEQAGVPIFGEAGSGYSIVDGYRLPPVLFTKEEALSFVGAQKLMGKFMDRKLQEHYEAALYKIKAVLRMTEKDWLTNIESKIVMAKPGYEIFNANVPHALSTLFESIAQRIKVALSYKGLRDELPQHRVIEPVGMFHEMNYWYIYAYCHARKAYRQFRADRIAQLRLLGEPFEQEHPTLGQFMEEREQARNQTPKTKVRIRVTKDLAGYLKWQRGYHGFVSERDCGSHVEMEFETQDTRDEFPRWLLMFGDGTQVIEPDSLRRRIAEILEAAAVNFR